MQARRPRAPLRAAGPRAPPAMMRAPRGLRPALRTRRSRAARRRATPDEEPDSWSLLRCAGDQCATGAECDDVGDGICAPVGTLGRKVRACAPASCLHDTVCNAEAGGICAPVQDACGNAPIGLFCVYPNGGCRSNADCPAGYCVVEAEGFAHCVDGSPVCPL
jgi:hypothetical protein